MQVHTKSCAQRAHQEPASARLETRVRGAGRHNHSPDRQEPVEQSRFRPPLHHFVISTSIGNSSYSRNHPNENEAHIQLESPYARAHALGMLLLSKVREFEVCSSIGYGWGDTPPPLSIAHSDWMSPSGRSCKCRHLQSKLHHPGSKLPAP